MPNWKPLLDRVLVKRDPPLALHPKTGLTLSFEEQENTRPHTGLVVAVGPGQWVNGTFQPVYEGIQVGVRVLFTHPDTLTKIEHDGEECLLMREPDVLSFV